jgi:hypothetical protein
MAVGSEPDGNHPTKEHTDLMNKLRLTARTKAVALLAASTGLLSAGTGLLAMHQAAADPGTTGGFAAPYVAVGSDTTQDVMNALSGESPGAGFGLTNSAATPTKPVFTTGIISSAATKYKQIISFDAVPLGGGATTQACITPKIGSPKFDRPNGSGEGVEALEDSLSSVQWAKHKTGPPAEVPCIGGVIGGGKVTLGANIDFARSSSGPPSSPAGSDLTWVPFARDAVMYVIEGDSAQSVTDASQLTSNPGNLHDLYNGAPGTIHVGSTDVFGCIPQPGSGTRSFFEGAIGDSDTNADAAAAAHGTFNSISCNAIEEHNGNQFDSFANSTNGFLNGKTNTAVVFPFSASQYVAQGNGFGIDRSSSFRTATTPHGLGDPDNAAGGSDPVTGTAPNLVGNPTFYASTKWGRDVYNVFPTAKLSSSPATRDLGIQSLFNTTGTQSGAADGICVSGTARTIVHNFGFLDSVPNNCGAITLTGSSPTTP